MDQSEGFSYWPDPLPPPEPRMDRQSSAPAKRGSRFHCDIATSNDIARDQKFNWDPGLSLENRLGSKHWDQNKRNLNDIATTNREHQMELMQNKTRVLRSARENHANRRAETGNGEGQPNALPRAREDDNQARPRPLHTGASPPATEEPLKCQRQSRSPARPGGEPHPRCGARGDAYNQQTPKSALRRRPARTTWNSPTQRVEPPQ